MAQYYLDIETTGFDKDKDKIITIQFQEIWSDGNPKGELCVLKEWESSEEAIVEAFHEILICNGKGWNFIPVGQNLIFDLSFLWAKFKKYGLLVPTLDKYIYDKPLIDIKHLLVICNKMSFKGAGLDKMTNKKTDGSSIPMLYRVGDWEKIEEYIEDETKSFLEFFRKCIVELPKLVINGS